MKLNKVIMLIIAILVVLYGTIHANEKYYSVEQVLKESSILAGKTVYLSGLFRDYYDNTHKLFLRDEKDTIIEIEIPKSAKTLIAALKSFKPYEDIKITVKGTLKSIKEPPYTLYYIEPQEITIQFKINKNPKKRS